MSESPRGARGVQIAAWLLTGGALLAVLLLHLLPALFAGLLVFELVALLTPVLARAIPNQKAKLVAVTLLSVVVVAALVGSGFALARVLGQEVGSAAGLFRKLATLLEDVRGVFPPWLLAYLPADPDALEHATGKWLAAHATQLQSAGTAFGRGFVKALVGMVIGAMLALHEVQPNQPGGPLSRALRECATHLATAFRRVVFAQVWISAINTTFTGIFLMVVLPLCGIHLPLLKTMLAITFLAGLLPVIGNLISNSLITFIGLSISVKVGAAALLYLILIHKLEYFLNARIVGGHINARAWELLIAMLAFESAFGLAGLVAAPVYYAYVKDELRRHGQI
ncbi:MULTISPECIES: AI-2E family transporter [Niveibacterium]|uniref:AI-2E family transporter n=1 Tax=Niveibacterium microcysteis TaxID=2811415 RepID=A0ABX7M6B2_9RHOO|nr:AI-2E family transporter [Niveibacterium microcysteis]QSI76000.1 AI-2E family transporter [Niveibacterium microcysteis]